MRRAVRSTEPRVGHYIRHTSAWRMWLAACVVAVSACLGATAGNAVGPVSHGHIVSVSTGESFGPADADWALLGVPTCESDVSVWAELGSGTRAEVPLISSADIQQRFPGVVVVSRFSFAEFLLTSVTDGATAVPAEITIHAQCGDTNETVASVMVSASTGQWSDPELSGTAQLVPSSGPLSTAANLTTGSPCPVGNGVVATIFGVDIDPSGYNVFGWTSVDAVASGPGMNLPLLQTFGNFQSDIGPNFTFDGDYTIVAGCREGLSASNVATFVTRVHIDAQGFNVVPLDPATVTVTPTGGTTVEISTSVRGAAGGAGILRIVEGSSVLVSTYLPQDTSTVTVTVPLGEGPHTLHAEFQSDDATVALARSSDFVLQGLAGQLSPGVVLTASPANPVPVGAPLTLTAALTPASSGGSMTFFDGSSQLGLGPVVGGAATLTITDLAPGIHSLSAVYRPEAGGDSGLITSAVVSVQIGESTNPGGVSTAPQPTVDLVNGNAVTVPSLASDLPEPPNAPIVASAIAASSAPEEDPGMLTISLDPTADGDVVLTNPQLSAGADSLATDGDIDPVIVEDTRPDSPGFSVTAQMSDFVGMLSGSVLPAGHAGIDPSATSVESGFTVGSPVSPAAPGAATLSAGLSQSRLMVSAVPGFSGTVRVGGQLHLRFPTNSAPDTYSGFLIITVS